MTKRTHEKTVRSEDPRDPVTVGLSSEQTRQLLEALADPPAANEALRKLMVRTLPWETPNV